ncbi:MAG: chromosome segregation protein SMC [Pirellulales bacterium]|nr:chromosome segregation protein SMC [Pirellulales bacterium]
MLKALELVGFKSFADRTRFEFPPGITVVVGPNGSGKSNVVDAMKWVLGEQSVKSLRGKEMADVIFNGSGSRSLLNSAEATLTFDNAQRQLALDSPEVHITRRVYRSGEGEYLINRQPCRLRDIRELFSGTGAATEAYSVIEQGKVDVLLQSSPRDRRMIFEEAAGISRFKAKKVESLRRLERVEQNLLRLSDIVEEVDNQLRSVRRQAGKAQRYREYSERLKLLRLSLGAADWRRLGQQSSEREAALAASSNTAAQQRQSIEQLELRQRELEAELLLLAEASRACDARLASSRELIVGDEAASNHERERLADLERERDAQRGRFANLAARRGDSGAELDEVEQSIEHARAERERLAAELAERQAEAAELARLLGELRQESEARRGSYMNLMRSAAALGNQTSAREQQWEAANASCERGRARMVEIESQFAQHRSDQERIAAQLTSHQEVLSQRQAATAEAKSALDGLTHEQETLAADVAQLRERHSAARERSKVLKELEDRMEGVGAGAKELLMLARQTENGPLSQVHGLVGHLLTAKPDMAHLIDAALGPVAEHLVIAPGQEFFDYLVAEAYRLPGRVGFISIDHDSGETQPDGPDLSGLAGVIGRATEFVEPADEQSLVVSRLVNRLFGRTWIVESLAQALVLSRGAAHGMQLVTLAGEVVGPDGLLAAGPRQAATGLISRRSELRLLLSQLTELATTVRARESSAAAVKGKLVGQQAQVEARRTDQLEAQHAVTELKAQLKELAHRDARLRQQQQNIAKDLNAATAARDEAERGLSAARGELATIEGTLTSMEGEIAAATSRLERQDEERRASAQDATRIEVRMAKLDEQLARLQLQRAQLADHREQRQRVLDEHAGQLARLDERITACAALILQHDSRLAQVYLDKQALELERARQLDHSRAVQQARGQSLEDAQALRAKLRDCEVETHRLELARRELELERLALANRLRDDYQVELSEFTGEIDTPDERSREEIDGEIAELRRKINSIGAVNLDALAELDELESRHQNLTSQFQDLAQAKSSLEQIIGKINGDSRRLLAETFETVRGHFQELFAKLFGGGHADIVLEAGVDILESGIEIVARPPGKEPRSISLLSGGEKTMTCVALLLAIFRSRPSPFCVLDEVDAALDEANIERFVGVLREFLAWTQFIIITHSKRTMTCANTLYGVTMQETGVSKRVSVQFEDVSETGEILSTAGRDDETQAA